ncbi:MAG: tetratricopeptide repeat protein [Prevotella sp.]|nr:tetratricopeptide repeat protein [Prevotella sp.]
MRKLLIAALMILGTSAAFAGDSDALKAILKAKTYDDAKQLLTQNLASLASAEEKAKAYNKLVDLSLDKVNKEQTVQAENQMTGGNKAVDEEGLYTAVGNAFADAAECDKYDQQPNEKGKVKPRFASKNADRLYTLRGQLINGGIYYQEKKDNDKAYKFLATYVDTASDPMFAKFDQSKDANLTNIAYYATIYAYQAKDWKNAEKYVEYAMKDPEKAKDALSIKFAVMAAQLKTKEDSVAYAAKLEDMYRQDPNNDDILSFLAITYSQLDKDEQAIKILDERLAADPNNFAALNIKGQLLKQKDDYDGSIALLEKALPLAKDDNQRLQINADLGSAYFYKAQERVNNYKQQLSASAREQFSVVYRKAIDYLEAAKALDVTKEQKRKWAYALYGSYYFVKGPNAPETQAAAADAGVNP